jgi:hypothetical protein
VESLFIYEGQWVLEREKLSPWQGYYLANMQEGSEVLLVDPDLSPKLLKPAPNQINAGGWHIRILAACQEALDAHNFAGVTANSENGWDARDLVEPPPIGEFVSLYFPHPEWQKPVSRFSRDMRSSASADQRWDFTVESNLSEELITVRFEQLAEVPNDLLIFLLDPDLQYKQDLRENTTYRFQARAQHASKALTLLVGSSAFVTEQAEGLSGLPKDFALYQNFPNPFNPETAIRFDLPRNSAVTLKIFDVNGREVIHLLDEEEMAAGRHQRWWHGRDAAGRIVASGLYFYRLTAPGFSRTGKMTFMK